MKSGCVVTFLSVYWPICLKQELQVLYRRQWQKESEQIQLISDEAVRSKKTEELDSRCWYTGERIVKELARWHVLKGEFLCKEFLSVPPPTPRGQRMLADVGIPLPSKIIPLAK